MELQDYELLVTLADTLSMRRATLRLGLSQPRLSQKLASMERRIGQALFERTPKGLRLTQAGNALLPLATEIIDLDRRAMALEKSGTSRNELRLGVIHTRSVGCLSTLFEKFEIKQPHVHVNVVQASLDTLFRQFEQGALDLCLCFEPPDFHGLCWKPMFRCPLVGLSAAKSAIPDEMTLEAFIKQPLALLTQNCSTRLSLDRALKSKGLQANPRVEMDDVTTIVSYVKKGRHASVIPERQAPQSRLLRHTRLFDPVIWVTGGVLHKPKPSRETMDFIEIVAEYNRQLK